MKITNTVKIFLTAVCAMLAMSCTPIPGRTVQTTIPSTEEKHAVATPETPPERDIPLFFQDDDSQAPKVAVAVPSRPEVTAEEKSRFAEGMTRVEFEQVRDDDIPPKVVVDPDIIVDPDTVADPDIITDPTAVLDPSKPAAGGKARIYLQRGFMDDAITELLRANPFGSDDGQNKRIFKVTDSTHRRMEFKLAGETRRANGRRATALDFVEIWSRFIASRPAQGLATFRHVQGIEEFISGKNPLVNGFNAADENTVRIRFGSPDPLAFHRMNTSKLIGGPFLLGPYYTGGTKGAETKLLPNKNTQSDIAYLEEIIVETGGSPDPMLKSFFNGEYSAIVLHGFQDLSELVARESENRAAIHKLPSDRYFLACRPAVDEQARRFVRNNVNGTDMLKTALGAVMEDIEGEAISGVSTNTVTAEIPKGEVYAPKLQKPFKIIYREDDPISTAVAKKVSADLNSAGMTAEAVGNSAENYEKALVRGQYDCAVGWVTEAVLESQTEQLHLATMWFNDEMNPQVRLREFREIPLFSVNNYLLLRDNIKLSGDRLSGMWIDERVGGTATAADGEN